MAREKRPRFPYPFLRGVLAAEPPNIGNEEEVEVVSEEAAKDLPAYSAKVAKRVHAAMKEVADEYTCPISFKLLWDPVTADDGRWYERAAIENWFDRNPGDAIRSPITNEIMSKRLLPANQVRNVIAKMVESGALGGEKAVEWKETRANNQVIKEQYALAELSNVDAYAFLGFAYREGSHGLVKDFAKALPWFKQAADRGHAPACTALAIAYYNAEGTTKNVARWLHYLAIAATLGSEHALGMLGYMHAKGSGGFPQDNVEASRFFTLMGSAQIKDANATYHARAAAHLSEHPDVVPPLPPNPLSK
jgi:hypothetical protein